MAKHSSRSRFNRIFLPSFFSSLSFSLSLSRQRRDSQVNRLALAAICARFDYSCTDYPVSGLVESFSTSFPPPCGDFSQVSALVRGAIVRRAVLLPGARLKSSTIDITASLVNGPRFSSANFVVTLLRICFDPSATVAPIISTKCFDTGQRRLCPASC